jgi:two-component system, LytTR family, sensor kinase
MQHPFLQNLKGLFIYLGMWVIVGIIHFFVLLYLKEMFWVNAMLTSLISNGIYSVLGFFLWYTVSYNRPTKSVISNLFFSHLMIATTTILIWYGLSNFLLGQLIDGKDKLVTGIIIPPMIFFYIIINLIYYLIIYYKDLQGKLQDENFLKESLRTTELNLLKSQINPHFLFNSLNSISSLTHISATKANEMIQSLSEYLRYSISFPDKERVELRTELDNIHRFLAIEKIRFGSRLTYAFTYEDACLDRLIPPMILQPIFENAVKHGVYESIETIHIEAKIACKEDYLELIVTNNFEVSTSPKSGTKLGLRNCSDRLRILYGNENLVQTTITDTLFTAKLIIPFELK